MRSVILVDVFPCQADQRESTGFRLRYANSPLSAMAKMLDSVSASGDFEAQGDGVAFRFLGWARLSGRLHTVKGQAHMAVAPLRLCQFGIPARMLTEKVGR
jgi:hypothetical protein